MDAMMPDSRDDQGPDLRATWSRGLPESGSSTDARFDRWLSWRLHDAYDSVLNEPLPAELDRLVQLLEAKDADSGKGEARWAERDTRGGGGWDDSGCLDAGGRGNGRWSAFWPANGVPMMGD